MTDVSLILPQNFTTPEIVGHDLFIAPMTPDMTFSDSGLEVKFQPVTTILSPSGKKKGGGAEKANWKDYMDEISIQQNTFLEMGHYFT